ncbi:three-Cys-motif partner protein TcmP [Nitrospirillum sp. BR 11164]|uniref:three-Cys-motif partner protein TcmP n=1 Tax=Nitrospirillum sp. BR 11164 TaxID=3104324 RepID=UPI002AFE18D7|nr:three-Cys-motif partner protein TcmP [Nitrospirillum sp. BR 11164]MEA1653014.1 three-Cys-motif partner protein TcmP [Nitrospirillum sp. BR 11164]
MRPDLTGYEDRGPAYVKHHFLADYVEGLVFKVASAWQDFVYVDGFSGPWQNQDEEFGDTSFGIALEALKRAKDEWKRIRNHDVRMTAILVERDPIAYARLQKVIGLYPDIHICTFNGDFVDLVPEIIRVIPAEAFTFILMDPKGWSIDMQRVAPLMSRPNCEVVLNFMFDFINRFSRLKKPAIQTGLNALLPGTAWRQRLDAIQEDNENGPTDRKHILVSSIVDVIKRLGRYPYVMETPVLFPAKNRTFYSLIYGTRSAKGVEVFRDAQHKALVAQDRMREELAVRKREAADGMRDLLAGVVPSNEPTAQWVAEQEASARRALIEAVPTQPNYILYKNIWPKVLAEYGVRRTRLGRIAAELKDEGVIRFLDWAPRKQVPDDNYRVTR